MRKIREENEYVDQIQVPLTHKNRYQIQVPLRHSHFHHLIVSNCLTGKICEDNKKVLQYLCYNFLLSVSNLCNKANFGHINLTM
jgi:hypothetical protein